MKVFIGADHRGVLLKENIVEHLQSIGHNVVDVGTFKDNEPCDYPDIAYKVATLVAQEVDSRGILLCMSGIGHSIAANKVPGAYAALCYNKESAALSRQHNSSNILVLGTKFVNENEINDLIDVWLVAEPEGGRHVRRFEKIKEIEKEFLK